AQNRAAQRAFRDRKERYVKSLEDRVKELEDGQGLSTDSKLAEENLTLKVLLQKLETENYILKEQAFTFDFPISQPGLYNIAKANRDMQLAQARAQATSSSTSSPATQVLDSASAASSPSTVTTAVPEIQAATTTSKTGTAKPVQFDQLPWSPPSSIGDSVPNSPLDHDLGAPEQDSTLQLNQVEGAAGVVPKFRQSSPEELALFSSILDGSGNTYASQSAGLAGISTTSANALAALSGVTSSSTLEQLMNVPLFGATVNGSVRFGPTLTSTASSTVASNTSIAAMSPLTVGGASSTELPLMPMFTFDQSHALFSNFRDPSDPQEFFASLEDPIEPTTGLFDGNFLDYSEAFSGVISEGQQSKDDILKLSGTAPAATAMAVTGGSGDDNERKLKGLPSLAENEQAIPCPQAWEHIAKHPNFDEADIDELCTEMKAKAKCSGHGPMIALKDVDNLLTKLD
ncbi:DNA-binding transcription factor yap1, partial [Lunasporangiospora selenospora]